jgi:O-antigen/teichoic acid export membrane protein
MTQQRATETPGEVMGPRGRAVAGLTDQAFAAAANAVNALVAGVLLGPAAYGRYVAAIGVAFITLAVARAFTGEVLLTYTARAEGGDYREQVRDATATSLSIGVVAMAVGGGIWLLGFELMSDLLWLLPFLPAALLADAGRYAMLSHFRPQRSMMITGIALLTQLGMVVALVVGDAVRPAWLLVAWGTGTTVGAAVALGLLALNPLRGRPRRWFAATRHLSTWFTGSAVLSQTQNWVVLYFVGGYLGHAELGGLRMLQMLVLMPVQNFIWAVSGLIVPGYSKLSEAGRLGRIRRRTQKLVLAFTAIAILVLAVVPLGELLLTTLLPAYQDFGVLVWPIAIQAGLYLAQSPLNAAMRGLQQARLSFLQYVVFVAVLLPASLVGAVSGGVLGAAYGMVVGALAGLLAAYFFYHRVVRELARRRNAQV